MENSMTKKVSVLLAVCFCLMSFTLAASPYYDSGSQRFTITAGTTFPLSITDFHTNTTQVGPGSDNTHMMTGGYGSILYQVFVNEYSALGGEIGYMFNYDNEALVTDVPIQAKATIFPIQGTVDIPLSLGLGFSFLSRGNSTVFTPFVSAELGLDFYITEHWGVGVKSGIWLVPELYFMTGRNQLNALATYIPLTVAVTYRQ
jgi:hypothetical protein